MRSRRIFRYKGVPVNIFGIPVIDGYKKERDNTSSVNVKRRYLPSFIANIQKNAPKDLLLMYDIPHTRKKERDWFRRQLKNFNFIMIQKSVWVGPSPLPKNFCDYVKRIGLQAEFKTFKLAKSYINRK